MSESLKKSWKNHMSSKTTQVESNMSPSKRSEDIYGLRACSIKKRIEVEARKGQSKKRGPKPKPKTLPMSKYRRKTANLRERVRMGEINSAFEHLRQKIPIPQSGTSKGKCEKLTKINILHVAITYIRALKSILDTGDAGVQCFGTSIVRSPIESCEKVVEAIGKKTKSKKLKVRRDYQERKMNEKKIDITLMSEDVPSLSDDSGVAGDGDGSNCEEWPDWTELTSTLDFQELPNDDWKTSAKPNSDVLLSNNFTPSQISPTVSIMEQEEDELDISCYSTSLNENQILGSSLFDDNYLKVVGDFNDDQFEHNLLKIYS